MPVVGAPTRTRGIQSERNGPNYLAAGEQPVGVGRSDQRSLAAGGRIQLERAVATVPPSTIATMDSSLISILLDPSARGDTGARDGSQRGPTVQDPARYP
jgi:hypothetical protein